MRCPICNAKITFETSSSRCTNGHIFSAENGVHRIMKPEYKDRLETFLNGFEDSRKKEITKYTPDLFPKLPFVSFDKGLWSLRQLDLKLVLKNLNPSGKALEIGAWNSWLTQHIARSGMETTAIDIFTHERDGLEAKKHYPEKWRAIQMDLQNLELFDERFDLIVVNRSAPYFEDLLASVKSMQQLLAKDGVLLFTGVTYESNFQRIQNQLDIAQTAFESKYGTPFKLHNYKGYLTKEDLYLLKKERVQLKLYKELRIRSLLARIVKSRPVYYYGIYTNKA